MCYRLIHEVHVEGWTVPHSSYHTLTSCVSVREKALSHLALYSVQPVHHRLVEITFKGLRFTNVLPYSVGLLVAGILVLFVRCLVLFYSSASFFRFPQLSFALHPKLPVIRGNSLKDLSFWKYGHITRFEHKSDYCLSPVSKCFTCHY